MTPTRKLAIVVALAVAVAVGIVKLGDIGRLFFNETSPIVSGVVCDSTQAVISGARFGPEWAVAVDDDFDGPAGARVGGPWYTESKLAGYWPRYDTKGGRNCAMQEFFPDPDGPDQYNSTLGLHRPTGWNDMKLRAVFCCEASPPASRNIKPVAMRGGRPGMWSYPNARFDVYPQIADGSGTPGHIYLADVTGATFSNVWARSGAPWSDGRWHTLEVDLSEGRDVYAAWIDGALFRTTAGPARLGGALTNLYLWSYNATDPGGPTKVWWDHVTVTAYGQVVLGDAQDWSACTQRKALRWASWTDTKITLPSPAGAGWLFVVNAAGVASERGARVE